MKSSTFGRSGCSVLPGAFVTSASVGGRLDVATSEVESTVSAPRLRCVLGVEFLGESVICLRAFANPNFVTHIERYASCAPRLQFQVGSRVLKSIGIHSVKYAFVHVERSL